MESPNVVTKRLLGGEFPGFEPALHSSRDVRKASARMRQYDLQLGELVERPGDDEFRRRGCALEREPQRVVDVGRHRQRIANALFPAVDVVLAVQRMKQQRIPKLLAALQHRLEIRLEYIVLALYRVR